MRTGTGPHKSKPGCCQDVVITWMTLGVQVLWLQENRAASQREVYKSLPCVFPGTSNSAHQSKVLIGCVQMDRFSIPFVERAFTLRKVCSTQQWHTSKCSLKTRYTACQVRSPGPGRALRGHSVSGRAPCRRDAWGQVQAPSLTSKCLKLAEPQFTGLYNEGDNCPAGLL